MMRARRRQDWRSGKGHRDENFPVASWLIHRRHRKVILAFYNFVRTADDIADHAALPPEEKLVLLDRLEAGLSGRQQRRCGSGAPAHSTCRAQSFAAARAGPACRIQARRDASCAIATGTISCGYCALFGDAGRPLRARRARRKPRRSGRPMTRCAPHCRSSIICRTAGTTISISTASTFRSTLSPPAGLPSKRSARSGRRRRCSTACTGSPNGPSDC